MPIDWSLAQPSAPPPNPVSTELASVQGLLQSIAEQRARAAEAQRLAAFQERKYQSDLANQKADNARADAYNRQQQTNVDRQFTATQASQQAAGEEKQLEEARKVLPGVRTALDANRPQEAAALGAPAGLQIHPQTSDSDLALGQVPPSTPSDTGQRITLPAGQVLNYDPAEAQRAEADRRARVHTETAVAMKPLARLPYGGRAAQETTALAPLLGKDESAASTFVRLQEADAQRAAAAANAAASREAVGGNRQTVANQRAQQLLERHIGKVIQAEQLQRLGTQYTSISEAQELMKDPAASSKRAAIDKFISGARGAMATGQFLDYFTRNISGGVNKLKSVMQRWEDGNLSEGDYADIAGAINATKAGIQHDAARKAAVYDRMTTNPIYQGFESNVADYRDLLFGQFDVPPRAEGGGPGVTFAGKAFKGAPPAAPAAGGSGEAAALRAQIAKVQAEIEDRLRGLKNPVAGGGGP